MIETTYVSQKPQTDSAEFDHAQAFWSDKEKIKTKKGTTTYLGKLPDSLKTQMESFLESENAKSDAFADSARKDRTLIPEAKERIAATVNHIQNHRNYVDMTDSGKNEGIFTVTYDDDGSIVGFSSALYENQLDGNKNVTDTYIGVGWETSGQGLGGTLLTERDSAMKDQGINEYKANVWRRSERLYQKLGLDYEEDTDNPFFKGNDNKKAIIVNIGNHEFGQPHYASEDIPEDSNFQRPEGAPDFLDNADIQEILDGLTAAFNLVDGVNDADFSLLQDTYFYQPWLQSWIKEEADRRGIPIANFTRRDDSEIVKLTPEQTATAFDLLANKKSDSFDQQITSTDHTDRENAKVVRDLAQRTGAVNPEFLTEEMAQERVDDAENEDKENIRRAEAEARYQRQKKKQENRPWWRKKIENIAEKGINTIRNIYGENPIPTTKEEYAEDQLHQGENRYTQRRRKREADLRDNQGNTIVEEHKKRKAEQARRAEEADNQQNGKESTARPHQKYTDLPGYDDLSSPSSWWDPSTQSWHSEETYRQPEENPSWWDTFRNDVVNGVEGNDDREPVIDPQAIIDHARDIMSVTGENGEPLISTQDVRRIIHDVFAGNSNNEIDQSTVVTDVVATSNNTTSLPDIETSNPNGTPKNDEEAGPAVPWDPIGNLLKAGGSNSSAEPITNTGAIDGSSGGSDTPDHFPPEKPTYTEPGVQPSSPWDSETTTTARDRLRDLSQKGADALNEAANSAYAKLKEVYEKRGQKPPPESAFNAVRGNNSDYDWDDWDSAPELTQADLDRFEDAARAVAQQVSRRQGYQTTVRGENIGNSIHVASETGARQRKGKEVTISPQAVRSKTDALESYAAQAGIPIQRREQRPSSLTQELPNPILERQKREVAAGTALRDLLSGYDN